MGVSDGGAGFQPAGCTVYNGVPPVPPPQPSPTTGGGGNARPHKGIMRRPASPCTPRSGRSTAPPLHGLL